VTDLVGRVKHQQGSLWRQLERKYNLPDQSLGPGAGRDELLWGSTAPPTGLQSEAVLDALDVVAADPEAKTLAGKYNHLLTHPDLPERSRLLHAWAFRYGIPDNPGSLRPQLWKVFLGYLDLEKQDSWEETLSEQRALYKKYLQEFPIHSEEDEEEAAELPPDPLGQAQRERQEGHVGARRAPREVREVLGVIRKDVQRTHPGIAFFHEPGVPEALVRILFIYASLNPGILYVQGMNETAAVLLYVFAQGEANLEDVEADTFFCFCRQLSETGDCFLQALDGSEHGLQAQLEHLESTLQEADPQLAKLLQDQQLSFVHFALRWVTTLLSREYELPETVRLWDSFLADTHRFQFVTSVCVAMLICLKPVLFKGDFAANLQLLQQFPRHGSMWSNDAEEYEMECSLEGHVLPVAYGLQEYLRRREWDWDRSESLPEWVNLVEWTQGAASTAAAAASAGAARAMNGAARALGSARQFVERKRSGHEETSPSIGPAVGPALEGLDRLWGHAKSAIAKGSEATKPHLAKAGQSIGSSWGSFFSGASPKQ